MAISNGVMRSNSPTLFLLEEKLTFQKKISGVIFEHDIPKELIIKHRYLT